MRGLFMTAAMLAMATTALVAGTGNGLPTGSHFTLNIQGKTNCNGSLTGLNGSTIQVLLNVSGDPSQLIDNTNKIFLQPGPAGSSPEVIDGNACDKDGATLQLPLDVATTWTAWARALSKPITGMNITSCAEASDLSIVCSTGNPLTLVRSNGKPVTINATTQLLFICVGGTLPHCSGGTLVPIFDPSFILFFWNVDNFGLRNAQIRFYPD